jgi:Zn-dependent peptidase ImmA (M78 family)
MATNYAGAVRNGSMAASRLHLQLDLQEKLKDYGGSIDVFAAALELNLPLILRPLDGLLGAYTPEPISGILVTTERPLSIQRFTAAHELGHYRLSHLPSLDNEDVLRRMAMPALNAGPNMQEVEANAFAVTFLMPKWLIAWHCQRQGWLARDLVDPGNAYQLALRLGTSYEAISWTLERHNLIGSAEGRTLRTVQPRQIKTELLREYRPSDYRGDVWLLTERDASTRIDGSRNDHFVLRLNEHCGGGYLWNMEQLQASGFAIVRDDRETADHEGVGGPVTRSVTAALEQAQRGQVLLAESRPWQPTAPISDLRFEYDFTGPEEEGLSRAERRHLLEAA